MMKFFQLSVPSHENIERNQSVFGSYLWVVFFNKINLQVLILLSSCLRGFTVFSELKCFSSFSRIQKKFSKNLTLSQVLN